jgi:hypothetical protein
MPPRPGMPTKNRDDELDASQVKRRLTWPDPSALALADAALDVLWRDSAALVGLPESQ